LPPTVFTRRMKVGDGIVEQRLQLVPERVLRGIHKGLQDFRLVFSPPPASVRAFVGPGDMAGGDIKSATQNRLRRKRRKLAHQEEKNFLCGILRQRRSSRIRWHAAFTIGPWRCEHAA